MLELATDRGNPSNLGKNIKVIYVGFLSKTFTTNLTLYFFIDPSQ